MSRISEWEIIHRPSISALSIRVQTSLKDLQKEMEEAREKLTAYFNHIDEYPAGAFYITYHSFSKQQVDFEAGFPTYRKLESQQEIECTEKRAGLFISCYHQGAYRLIPKVYRDMEDWMDQHQYESDGVSEEIYLNHEVPEDQMLTQILLPLQPKK